MSQPCICKNVILLSVSLLSACVYHELENVPSCDELPLSILVLSKKDNDSCVDLRGSITVASSGGTVPVQYRINGHAFQISGHFQNLPAGTYNIEGLDSRGCSAAVQATINSIESDLVMTANLTADTECLTNNGTASFDVSGGSPPYQYFYLGVTSPSPPSLSLLSEGTYWVQVIDFSGCSYELGFTINRGFTGVSWKNDIHPIVEARCATSGCHVEGTGRVDFTLFNNVKAYATSIKLKTTNRSMPYDGSLEQSQIRQIACWVDDGALDN